MKEKQNILKILGFAISLPSAILGTYFLSDLLEKKGLIPGWVGTAIIICTVLIVLYLMVKYALKQ